MSVGICGSTACMGDTLSGELSGSSDMRVIGRSNDTRSVSGGMLTI